MKLYLLFAVILLAISWKVGHDSSEKMAKIHAQQNAQMQRIFASIDE